MKTITLRKLRFKASEFISEHNYPEKTNVAIDRFVAYVHRKKPINPCSEKDCFYEQHSKGLCGSHYNKQHQTKKESYTPFKVDGRI